jgi:tetratricopeptide (TPR) repeat protein
MSPTKLVLSFDITQTEQYPTLLRALRRRQGFGIQFVQCSPGQAKQLIQSLKQDLSQKNVGILNLEQPTENLFDLVQAQPNLENLDILFIQGIERSLEPYIKPGYGGVGDYYKLDTVPPILNHLNQQRENFRDRFNHLCFVFIVPLFALKYFIHRAPDFFDWRSGIFKFSGEDSEGVYPTVQLRYPNLFAKSSELDREYLAGIKPETYEAFCIQGVILHGLGRYEEALASYDKALQIKPDDYEIRGSRSLALSSLGRYEEALASDDKVLEIQPDDYRVWNNRGVNLHHLGRHKEALASYDKALQIKPDDPSAFYNKACTYALQANLDAALENLSHAIALDPNEYRKMAETDSDFDIIRKDQRFWALVDAAPDQTTQSV